MREDEAKEKNKMAGRWYNNASVHGSLVIMETYGLANRCCVWMGYQRGKSEGMCLCVFKVCEKEKIQLKKKNVAFATIVHYVSNSLE